MKRWFVVLAMVATLVPALAALAAETKAPAKEMTLRGEVVDSGCYLSKGAHGPDHKECATKCVSGGMPMGLLTSNNKFYLLTPNHQNADPYEQLKSLVASNVEVTGKTYTRNGVTMIDVTAVKTLD